MKKLSTLDYWKNFSESYNFELKEKIWDEKSKEFGDFWAKRIMKGETDNLDDEELDKIIRILDRNAKGNSKENEAVARAMIAQGAWRRMFREIKTNQNLKETINSIFVSDSEEEIEKYIDRLYEINSGRKNFLTGINGNAINDMMFAYNPKKYIAVVSLNHRSKIIDYFKFIGGPNFEEDSQGKKIILSNKVIIAGFRSLEIDYKFPRAISDFLYTTLKDFWNKKEEYEDVEEIEIIKEETFEKRIERLKEDDYQKIIHQNFKYIFPELDYFDKDTQDKNYGHYVTTEGKEMDFLCKNKKGDFVVIELKIKGADQAVGQVCRYMGWVKENLCEGNQKVEGIIVSQEKDIQLDYAIKVVPGVIIKKMVLDIKLMDWEK